MSDARFPPIPIDLGAIPEFAHTPLIIVGGTGGSGTRLVTQCLRQLGVDMGERVNASDDALALVDLYDTFIPRYWQGELPRGGDFTSALDRALTEHLHGAPGDWGGFKNPRSIFLLPLLMRALPRAIFVHAVRNGIDMAFSENQRQLDLHGAEVPGVTELASRPLQSVALWARINLAAAEYGRQLGPRYARLRYEDLCEAPARALAPLARALGREERLPALADVPVERSRRAPVSEQPRDLLAPPYTEAGTALERFGYPCSIS